MNIPLQNNHNLKIQFQNSDVENYFKEFLIVVYNTKRSLEFTCPQ